MKKQQKTEMHIQNIYIYIYIVLGLLSYSVKRKQNEKKCKMSSLLPLGRYYSNDSLWQIIIIITLKKF